MIVSTRQVLIDILEGQSQWKRHIFALFSKSSFAGLGALWVRQALFSKIFEKFEKFRIFFIPWPFSLDKNSLRYWKFKDGEKSIFLPRGGVFFSVFFTFLGTRYYGPMIYSYSNRGNLYIWLSLKRWSLKNDEFCQSITFSVFRVRSWDWNMIYTWYGATFSKKGRTPKNTP